MDPFSYLCFIFIFVMLSCLFIATLWSPAGNLRANLLALLYFLVFFVTFLIPKQAFRFMVGPGHCPMISKYCPSLSKVVGPVDPSFLVVEKSHFDKKYSSYSKSTNSTKQKVHVGSQYSKTCLKQSLKKDKTKILITNGSLMKVES